MIGVVDYGIGNLTSAKKSLDYLGVDSKLLTSKEDFKTIGGLVLPGVGAFGPTMTALEQKGLAEAIVEYVAQGKPYLGICVGMQVLFDSSEENPGQNGLSLIQGKVKKLSGEIRIPQMQWNQVHPKSEFTGDKLIENLGNSFWMYFLHSYSVCPTDESVIRAVCEYGGEIVSYLNKDNIFAVQFHPEKSSSAGLKFMSNFVDLCQTGGF